MKSPCAVACLSLALTVLPSALFAEEVVVEHVINYNPGVEDIDFFPDAKGNLLLFLRRFDTNGSLTSVSFETRNKKKKVTKSGPIDELSGTSSYYINQFQKKRSGADFVYTKADGSNQVVYATKFAKKGVKELGKLEIGSDVDDIDVEANGDYVFTRISGRTVNLVKHSYPKFKEEGTFEATGDDVGVTGTGKTYIARIRDSVTNSIESYTYKALGSKLDEEGSFGPVQAQDIDVKLLGKKSVILEVTEPDGTNQTAKLLSRKLEGTKEVTGIDDFFSGQQFFPSQFEADPVGFPDEFLPDSDSGSNYEDVVYYQIVSVSTGTNTEIRIIVKRF